MKLETPLIAMLLGSLFFTGMYITFFQVADAYDVSYDMTPYQTETRYENQSFFNALAKANETKATADAMTDTVMNMDDPSIADIPFWLGLVWEVGVILFGSLSTGISLFGAGAAILGIPGSVVAVLATIVIVVFVIAVLVLILGRANQ